MMMKWFKTALAAAIAVHCISCTGLQDGKQQSKLMIGFAEPVVKYASVAGTRETLPDYDTSSFSLLITDSRGNSIYNGPYGHKPEEFILESGAYEISVASGDMTVPAFENPVYGDKRIVVLESGKSASVRLLCKMKNCGIRLSFTENFRKRFPSGPLVISQENGKLDCAYDETRTAYVAPGNTVFLSEGGTETLFNRVLEDGTLYRLTLDAVNDKSGAGISLEMDDTVRILDETFVIGDESSADADGSCRERALDIAAAARRSGDTVWVWGYIVGGDLSSTSVSFSPPFTKSSNLALAKTPGEKERDRCFPVELSRTAVKQALNLLDHPENLGKKVYLLGTVSDYFSLKGLKKVTDFSF